MLILFLNHKSHQCGVYQYGVRLYDILSRTQNIQYIYREVNSLDEYNSCINERPDYYAIFYNYHFITMPWLNINTIQKRIKNIGLQHDLDEYNMFEVIIRLDVTLQEEPNKYNILRPLFENTQIILNNYQPLNLRLLNFINYHDDGIPTIGSFGFGGHHKAFDKVVELVNNQYDKAVIKLLIPSADFGPKHEDIINLVRYIYSKITKPGIKLLTFHEFVKNEDILLFLSRNTINLFLYDTSSPHFSKAGLSSVIDYAISVKKPFGISNSNMFRHVYSDNICAYKTSINEIIKLGSVVCEKYLCKFSNDKLITQIANIITDNKILGIIPLGGSASRMKNIPKYLLPCIKGYTLLDNTIEIFNNNSIFDIIAGVSLMNSLILENNHKIDKIVVETKTMAETVHKLIHSNPIYSDNYKNILIMPDTFFQVKDEFARMKRMLNDYEIVVIIWKIKDYQIGKVGQCAIIDNEIVDVIDKDINCTYPYFWGCIGWNSSMNQHIIPEWETIGNLIKRAIELNIRVGCIESEGYYYDCGTFDEYFKMIKTEL
jgi:hypothetical protein